MPTQVTKVCENKSFDEITGTKYKAKTNIEGITMPFLRIH